MAEPQLPEAWIITELDSILLSIVGGGTPSKSNLSYYRGNIPWMSVKDMNKNILEDTIDHISLEAVNNSSTNIIPAGTPIIATRMSLGKIVVAKFDSAINQDLKALFLPASISSDYLVYWYRSIARQIEELGTGTTVKGIRLENLKVLEFPVAPLAEQKVIADKLDILLAQVESTKARLERIPQILKRFRQSVLAAAVSGKLTEEWRRLIKEYPSISYKERKLKPKPELYEQALFLVPDLPPEWEIVPSAHLLDYITSGSRGWARYYSKGGALFLRMSNVRYDTTKLDLNDLQFVDLPQSVEGKRSLLEHNDLVISITADVGRVARIDRDLGEAYINQHLALARPVENFNSEFLAMCIAAQNIGIRQIQEFKRGATKAGLGLDDIRSLAIPTPSLEEQTEIVRRVEQLFAYADTIEQQVHNALARVNNLTQSILAKAFRGELTEQWRKDNLDLISGDNSAKALLEKIKAERKALAEQPKKRILAVKQKTGGTMSKSIIKVTEALRKANKPLTGQELMAAAGYPSNSSTEQLEQFFLDVRDALEAKQIIKLKRDKNGQDWFSLNETTES
ncbi:restriction endonuclease subunit S [Methylobacter sp. BlB1]|uniref:restriction endonuclease subunit S n=1 Tax=Methylobacter sp. BlB1 TaxID=2785914 RepID=UPI0018939464|nr:restriction endonuclease subunit S [Methylobacter sp. BlB1]MBF6650925.1 restriction endonuclease subunit S [Methylobacter sp. BlB1]